MSVDTRAAPQIFVLEDPIRILFVDDDPILREFALVHLSTEQARVDVRADGVEALEALATGDYDVVLLDLEMPRMDGFEALARIRADERTRALPVIVVTGREDIAAIDRAYQAGATSFLVKPINWRLLSYQILYAQRIGQAQDSGDAGEKLRRAAADAAELIRLAVASGDPRLLEAARTFGARLSDNLGEG